MMQAAHSCVIMGIGCVLSSPGITRTYSRSMPDSVHLYIRCRRCCESASISSPPPPSILRPPDSTLINQAKCPRIFAASVFSPAIKLFLAHRCPRQQSVYLSLLTRRPSRCGLKCLLFGRLNQKMKILSVLLLLTSRKRKSSQNTEGIVFPSSLAAHEMLYVFVPPWHQSSWPCGHLQFLHIVALSSLACETAASVQWKPRRGEEYDWPAAITVATFACTRRKAQHWHTSSQRRSACT